MGIGLFVIGDEIMRAKKQDQHFAKLVELLGRRGMHLSWAQYLGDEPHRLVAAFKRSFGEEDIVFSCGGIGATPDDHTRACVAEALGVELALHPEAEDLIHAALQKRSGTRATAQQLQMGFLPVGARIVPNRFNGIPGFSVGDHHFFPGFPEMAWPMMQWLLDERYAHLHHKTAEAEDAIYVYDVMESTLTPLMREIEMSFTGLKTFSLPHLGTDGVRRHVELGVRGDPAQIDAAMQRLVRGIAEVGGSFSVEAPPRCDM